MRSGDDGNIAGKKSANSYQFSQTVSYDTFCKEFEHIK